MKVGILKEIKVQERRVAMTPSGVEEMIRHGHRVLVERDAGLGSGFADTDYRAAGAEIAASAATVYAACDMVMHVKEPQHSEYGMIRKGQILFTYFHLAPDPELTRAMLDRGAVCIAYETVRRKDGSLPLLTPMSEVAGRLSVLAGARYLEANFGGTGIFIGGVTGVAPAEVLVLGGGTVGYNAALMACGLGAHVHVLDASLDRLRQLSSLLPANAIPLMSAPDTVRRLAATADLVIGSVLIPGARTPRLITRNMLRQMKKGAVIVDVAIDQGGCIESSRPTTFDDPVFVEQGIIHYCVTNMPGAVPRTSTLALTNATLPYALALADKGWQKACRDDEALLAGLNIAEDHITHPAVAAAMNTEYRDPSTLL